MLDIELSEYAKTNAYPFHMPGHKRQMFFQNPYAIDITEIGGFDNLHHSEGILKEAQERAKELYGARKTYYLVNGSTCGLLAAICAVTCRGDKVLVARNCHKAVYHAVFLQELIPEYLFPEQTRCGIQGQITVNAVKQALQKHSGIRAVILTSPTYDGVVSDIAGISEVVHRHGIPLIVDEAHGAHLGFSEGFPPNAITLGADVVVLSIHKTLPAFTQTALLHLCSERVNEKSVEEYLDIFETSSPSYILMAGMERCIRMIAEKKNELFSALEYNLGEFYTSMAHLKNLHILRRQELTGQEAFNFDESKILIFTGGAGIDGRRLQELLRSRYQLELEMACSSYAMALSSVMDTKEGFHRLAAALSELDVEMSDRMIQKEISSYQKHKKEENITIYRHLEKEMEIHEAKRYPVCEMDVADAVGQISADYILPYPPGIPVIVPGERIDEQLIIDVMHCKKIGLDVEGITPTNRINVVKLE